MEKEKRNYRQAAIVFLFAILLAVIGCRIPVQAEEAVLLEQNEAVIYGLDSSDTEISIPEDGAHPQTFQIKVNVSGQPTYRVLRYGIAGLTDGADYNDDAVEVSEDGLVTVGKTIWYNAGGYWTTQEIEGAQARVSNNYGTAIVRVSVGDDYQDLRIQVKDYSNEYYEEKLDAYLAENITPDMTELEKIQAITRYPASFEYSAYYSSGRGMVLHGGGDCWASSGLIIDLAKKLGFKAWVRNANRDAGAGSGHRNALVESTSGDVWYECEAGYGMAKSEKTGLRPYHVTKRTSLYCYYMSTDSTIGVYQYDGYEPDATTLCIPSEIDGRTVTHIESKFLYGDSQYTEVKLPDSITTIGEDAFFYCRELQKLEIPASVTELKGNPFAASSKLTGLTVAEDNPCYKMEDGILYTADLKTLIAYPAGKTEKKFTVQDGVEKIGDSAFHVNANLEQIYLPDTVKQIGADAFYGASALKEIRMPDGLESIGDGAFYQAGKLKELVVPQTVTSVGQFAFYRGPSTVYVQAAQAEFGENVLSPTATVYCTEGATVSNCVENAENVQILDEGELAEKAGKVNELTEPVIEATTEEQTATTEGTGTQPTTEKATDAEGSGTQPSTEKATDAEGRGTQPSTEKATDAEGSGTQPSTETATDAEGSGTQASTEKATTMEGSGTQPTTEKATTTEGTGTQPSTEKATTTEGTGMQPATGNMTTESGLVSQPTTQETVSEALQSVKKVTGFKAKAKKKKLVLKWNRVNQASGYEIQVSLKKSFRQPVIYRLKASKKSLTVSRLKGGRKYYVRIRAYRTYSTANGTMDVYGNWKSLKAKTKK